MSEELRILEKLERKVDSLSSKLTHMLNKPAKQTWVGIATVKYLTGWSGENFLKRMRDDGCVIYDKEKGYLLESIPEVFLRNTPKL
ncbi:MAG: hypothetical protein H7178_10985 [Chitinophagaceae bacterium]|nr:hypothetical protein [Chitinophagaceae bacterium]